MRRPSPTTLDRVVVAPHIHSWGAAPIRRSVDKAPLDPLLPPAVAGSGSIRWPFLPWRDVAVELAADRQLLAGIARWVLLQ